MRLLTDTRQHSSLINVAEIFHYANENRKKKRKIFAPGRDARLRPPVDRAENKNAPEDRGGKNKGYLFL